MRMLINGEWIESEGGGTREVIDPATLESLDVVPDANGQDVSKAVDAAADCFHSWSSIAARERGRILYVAAQRTKDDLMELASLLSREQGKPLGEDKGEILGYINVLEFFHSVSGSMHGSHIDLPGIGHGLVTHHPLGVCAAIIPWNVPALTMAWKIAPALVTGNTVVLKPAPTTPLTNLRLASILQDSGLPRGALNLICGDGVPTGECLVTHPSVEKISFTGSTEVGRIVAANAGRSLKKVSLELGGSDPAIICSDVDLHKTAKEIVSARFYNCGQACTSLKRLYVMEDVADELEQLLRKNILAINVGRGLEPEVDMGPVHSSSQLERIVSQLESWQDEGEGKLVFGGARPDINLPGYFLQPTLIRDPSDRSRLLREEVFGPVLPMMTVRDLDEALERANSNPFGLGASIWTQDISRIQKAVSGFQSGRVWVNMHLRVPVELPFGGCKSSGIGQENGLDSLQDYQRIKTVVLSR